MARGETRTRLTPHDWAAAGLTALAEGGLAAVAVEPVAARLGATKGSFYWHFPDRAALVDAVLALWERVATHDVVARLDEVPEPAARFEALFELTFADPRAGVVDAALLAHASDARVAPVLERVTRARVEWMARTFRACGVPAAEAGDRALEAYVLWVGLLQLTAAVPQVLPAGEDGDRFLRSVLARLRGLLPG